MLSGGKKDLIVLFQNYIVEYKIMIITEPWPPSLGLNQSKLEISDVYSNLHYTMIDMKKINLSRPK